MKEWVLIFSMITMLYSCQKSKQKTNNMENSLIENLDLSHSIFSTNEVIRNKYAFENIYIEDLSINELLKKEYRHKFFEFLKNKTSDDDLKATLFCQLLLIRIQQLKDTNSFYLLSEASKYPEISSNGIELLGDNLVELFLDDPYFFIQQGAKYNDKEVNGYIMNLFKDFIITENFFKENIGEVSIDQKVLLLEPKLQEDFTDQKLIEKLAKMPKVEAFFSPSLYTGWKNKTIFYTNIYSLFNEKLTKQFNSVEFSYYNSTIASVLNKYIIDRSSICFIIQDTDGYTNLRKSKNNSSDILQKVKTGEPIEVLDNSGDWFLVKTKEGKEGYVHKSRIQSE